MSFKNQIAVLTATSDQTETSQARDLLLQGSPDEALKLLLPLAKESPNAALMLCQVLAFSGDWQGVRELSSELLRKPFELCQYRDAQDVMKLFALSATTLGDWPEAIKAVDELHLFLEELIDTTGEANSYSESFNRFEAYIRSAGRGQRPFKITSPVSFAAMGEEQYARLLSLKNNKGKSDKAAATFAELDIASRHDFYLWKALYDEDIETALKLYEENADFVRGLNQAGLIAQLLMSFANDEDDERAWQIIRNQLPGWNQQYYFEIAPIDLLWDEKVRPLMTSARCLELLSTPRAVAPLHNLKHSPKHSKEQELYFYQREKITHIATLARSLTDQAVAHFEEQVKLHPESLLLHTALIGVYSKFAAAGTAAKLPHVAWFTRKFADSAVVEDILSYLLLDKESDPEGFEKFKQEWLEIVAENPENSQVLFNASLLLGIDDSASAEEFLQRAQSLEPDNAKFAERLFELNAFQVSVSLADKKIRHAREALAQVDKIEEAGAGRASDVDAEFDQLRLLRRRAWFTLEAGSLDACARLNDDMVNTARTAGFGERYEYLSDVITARLATRVGDLKNAVKLLTSLKEKGLWRHFKADMPHMTLLAELASAGQQAAALDLLLTTRADWPGDQEAALERAVKAISDGETPWVQPVRL
jgi:hypothetical protein